MTCWNSQPHGSPPCLTKAEFFNIQRRLKHVKHVHVNLPILIVTSKFWTQKTPKHRHCWALLFWDSALRLERTFQAVPMWTLSERQMPMCQNVALLSPKDGCCIARHGWVYPKSSHEWLALGQRAKDLWMSKQKLRPQRQPCDMLQSCCTNCTNAEFFPRSFLPFCGETMTFLNSDTISTDIFQAMCGTIWPHQAPPFRPSNLYVLCTWFKV